MQFTPIDLGIHRKNVIDFRRDSFAVSFKDTSGFDEKEYLEWLKEKIKEFPAGFVMVVEKGEPVGQLELSTREHEGRRIGYVHLYYLSPEYRGKGIGTEIHRYALQYFKTQSVTEFHLRVSPTNIPARKFYRKIGLKEIGPEMEGRVIRMKGEADE
ncbi:N-acetyltransferase family protein [Bacillus sp. SCS-153A]|uniref:GNAT family N-acetyltransferase n=1 Tax=Rossellomorea sedimentorum TaxID=3115294 RepID=UPI0039063426